MNDDNFRNIVLATEGLADSSWIAFPNPVIFHLAEVDRGILFVFASLSGPSLLAWRLLVDGLINRNEFRVPVYVFDNYSLPESFVREVLQQVPTGYGDTYWVVGGKIVKVMHGCGDGDVSEIRLMAHRFFHRSCD